MRRQRMGLLIVPVLCAPLLAGPLVAGPLAGPSAAAGASTGRGAVAPAQSRAATPGRLTLPTGQRVAIRTVDGRPEVQVSQATGAVTVLQAQGHVYAIPAAVSPLIGHGLTLSMFDVTELAAAPARQPLRLQAAYLPGRADLPAGLTRVGTGQLAVTDPSVFGAAVAQAARTYRSTGTMPTLLRGLRLSLAGSPARTDGRLTAPTKGQLYTVTVKGLDRSGRRDEGDIGVLDNVDNTDRFIAGQTFYHGSFAFSVPRGHYSVQAYIATTGQKGLSFTLATVPQFFVGHDVTVTLDARSGTRVSTTTPRPSTPVHAELNLQREPATGLPFTDSLTTFDATPLYATPTGPVRVGRLYFYPAARLGDGHGSTGRYLYDVEFPMKGRIPTDLHFAVTDDDLAAVTTRYASVLPGRDEQESRIGGFPWQTVLVGAIGDLDAPLERTEYVSAAPHLSWHQEVDLDPNEGNGRTLALSKIYRGGQQLTHTWHDQPMGSGFEQERQAGQACPVCRSGDTLSVVAFPHVDDDGDFMLADAATSEGLTLYENGSEIGSSRSGFGSFTLDPDPASYRLEYDVSTTADWWPTATQVSTSWTFTSQERDPDQLPPGWTCGGKLTGAIDDGCSFEDVLLPRIRTGAGLDGVVPAGSSAHVDVRVSPQFGADADPLAALTGQVSYDGGKTWTDVTATRRSDTTYRLRYRQPGLDQTDGFASLRIVATGQSGSEVDQTVLHAYPLAPLSTTRPAVSPLGGARLPSCAAAVAPPLTRCQVAVPAAGSTQDRAGDPPAGYGPADLREAYHLPAGRDSETTVAIVTPYDDPSLDTDLAAYRTQFGLTACRVKTGCLAVVNQDGAASPLPQPSPDWALQTSQALDAVSAVCPSCRLLVVEANSSSLDDLVPAASTAAGLGAGVIYGGYGTTGEFSGEQRYERSYRTLGVPFVVASGNYGYGNGAPLIGSVSYPSASRYAVAVGGTTLTRNAAPTPGARAFTETVWADTTSGCSAYITKPGWQADPLCGKRTTADVAAVADPTTSTAVYDSFGYAGWVQAGGTSLAAAVVAGVYGLNGQATANPWAGLYAPNAKLYDVTSGSNGRCRHSYLCVAKPGFDGPSGVGTPNGVSAFR